MVRFIGSKNKNYIEYVCDKYIIFKIIKDFEISYPITYKIFGCYTKKKNVMTIKKKFNQKNNYQRYIKKIRYKKK